MPLRESTYFYSSQMGSKTVLLLFASGKISRLPEAPRVPGTLPIMITAAPSVLSRRDFVPDRGRRSFQADLNQGAAIK